jgi:uncharacterized protein
MGNLHLDKAFAKLHHLTTILKQMESALLSYSGGVDSTFLLKALQISGIRVLAVIAVSETTPGHELRLAKSYAEASGIKYHEMQADEMSLEEFIRNSPDRCYICKNRRFERLSAIASEEGYRVVLDGSQSDDAADYRPGKKAAEKYNIRSPLAEAGLSKDEIRELSRHLNLVGWDRPASSCLATRFPYGQRITKEALKRVEKAEAFLRGLGFRIIRVRDHGGNARIEVGRNEIEMLLGSEKRVLVKDALKSLGFAFVSLDLEGYYAGSMNRGIT